MKDARLHSARARAVEQLQRIEVDRAFVGFAGEGEAPLDARAERQLREYVAGVTRWRRRLDFLLAHFYRGDFEAMEPTLRQILRVGLYDLLYLDTPPHAALNEAVELAKRKVRPGAGGLVNGVLRAVLRAKDRLPQPSDADPAEALAIRYSHPSWLVRRWIERYGPADTEALLQWNNERPVYGVRVNTLKNTVRAFTGLLDDAGVPWTPSPYLDPFVRVSQLQPILRSGWLGEGRCAVQDESAGLVVRLLDPQPGETLLDACAAPGGKALFAAARMENRGRVLAFDLHEGRLGLAARAADDQGVTILTTEAADLRALARREEAPQADRVLLDAPCSGLGVLAKRADLRWHRAPEEIGQLARLQDELLDAAAACVRPGGVLVYSTCTIEPDENQARIAPFLERHPAFEVEPAVRWLPEEVVTPEGFMATLPHRHRMDGAFAARLVRRG
ncbi:MAG: 16S rRNA (cytosine(967)-C(5))-methyltransferase RsmB [Rhodothermales bacterium]|nr:16S rRNA (cytosine(967)-C(5))-methyltransferase RsmB [Rhodothermales bacterium]